MNGDWESTFVRAQAACSRCEKAFSLGDDFCSWLQFGEEGLERVDVCVPCTEASEGEAERFAFWRTRIAKKMERPRRLDVAFLIDFFRRLQDQLDDEKHVQVAYIVALLLLRKKTLVLQASKKDEHGRELMVLRFAKDEDETDYTVPVPELTEERMALISDDLGRIFNIEEPEGAKQKAAAAAGAKGEAEASKDDAGALKDEASD